MRRLQVEAVSPRKDVIVEVLNVVFRALDWLGAIHPALEFFAPVVVVFVLLAIFFLLVGPRVTVVDQTPAEFGRNAMNTALGISICRDVGSEQSWIGVLAQEAYEFRLCWKWLRLNKLFGQGRELELRGHAVECAAAAMIDGRSLADYELSEAIGMQAGYGGLFRDLSVQEVLVMLVARRPLAAAWVQDHRGWLLEQRRRALGWT